MKELVELYKKINGTEILNQYHRRNVLFSTFLLLIQLGICKKTLEIIRLINDYKLHRYFKTKYKKFIKEWMECNAETGTTIVKQSTNGTIWFCWLQGLDFAPEVVKKCYASICHHICDRNVIVITFENYKNYVTIPEFVENKVKNGTMSLTHFSDIIRLELLISHGGTWMDATLFCTGTPEKFMLDSDLFLFQNLKPGLNGHSTCISNWYITSRKDNKILRLTRDLLYNYWMHHRKIDSYYIFHHFFQLAIESYPEDWSKVIPFSNSTAHILLLRLFDTFDEYIWDAIKIQCPLHKLTYKIEKGNEKKSGTYYERIFND